MMLTMLIAYNAAGDIIATLDHMVAHDENGEVVGLVDFAAHEEAGGQLLDIWNVPDASGSGTWPEWLGTRAHDFRVQRAGGRIRALVHKTSHRRRTRSEIETTIATRIAEAEGKPVDIRDITGGPTQPLVLDDEGRTIARRQREPSDLAIASRR